MPTPLQALPSNSALIADTARPALRAIADRRIAEVHLGHRLAVDEPGQHGRPSWNVVGPDVGAKQRGRDVRVDLSGAAAWIADI